MVINYANCKENRKNVLYPNKKTINDINDLKEIVTKYDYTFTNFKDDRRSTANFINAEYVTFDCDNSNSENDKDWIKIEDIANYFKDVSYYLTTSRNHNKVKNGKKARPKFHVIFKVNNLTNINDYNKFMKSVCSIYSFFDTNAIDPARFMFPASDAIVIEHKGKFNLSEHMDSILKFDTLELNEKTPILEGFRNTTMNNIAGKLLIRYGDTNESYEKYLKEAMRCEPPLSDEELNNAWDSAKNFYEKISKKPGYIKPEDYNKEITWDDPIPLEQIKSAPFPVDTLPKDIREYVEAVSKSTQTPVDMSACAALTILALCCQGKYRIAGKKDWIEPLNLFTLIIAEPSERKSAIISSMVKPLNEYEKDYNIDFASIFEKSKIEKGILENKKRALEAKATKGEVKDEELNRLSEAMAKFKEIKPLKLYVDDVTTEKLTNVLYEQNGRIGLISAEGGIFDMLSGLYNKNVNIDVFLKGHSGDSIRVDRIGRNSELIENPCLTVLLTVQSTIIRGLMSNKTFRGRGLTARFLYCYPESIVGSRKYRTEVDMNDAYKKYKDIITNILKEESNEYKLITLSPEADKLLENFADMIESKLPNEYIDISDWVGKLVGVVLRISGILARSSVKVLSEFMNDVPEILVRGEIMENAIKIGRYYLEHAKYAFSVMGANTTIKESKYLLDTIKKKNYREFSIRDIMRSCRIFKTKDQIEDILDYLMDYGYVMLKDERNYYRKGRPTGSRYIVNPKVFE